MLRSLLVKDYMSGDPLAFSPEMDVLDAIHKLIRHEITGAPVIDHLGKVVGFLSEKDCLKVALSASYHEQRGGRVSEFMTHDVITLEGDATLTEAAELFVSKPYRCYPVVAESRLIGQLTRRNVLKALEKLW
ncbi:MAG: CBS domain-containing protein [Rhodocyclaceae bacterium]|jgi:CBS domain-containing protein|nr:CBS domain-containing protein [Rhodocyclaceae bacterium]MCL4757247.1 CBS domain-containing protein [Rhodocyclaceae bacterium]